MPTIALNPTNVTLYDENLASFLLEMSNLAYCDQEVH